MADDSEKKAPMYVSFLTFVTLLDWLREMKVIPSNIDRSLWGEKFAGGTGAQLMVGLRFLGLLAGDNGDEPKDELEHLAQADDEARKPLLRELLRRVYGADFITNLPRMTPKVFEDRMRELGTTDATHRKAISFFINAAKAADVELPASIAKKARNRPPVANGQKRSRQRGGGPPAANHDGGAVNHQQHQDERQGRTFALHSTLMAMLKDLEGIAPDWNQRDRDRWLKTFETNLDYAYPAKDEEDALANA